MIDEEEKAIFRQNILPQYLDYISNIKKSKKSGKNKKIKYKQIERIKNETN